MAFFLHRRGGSAESAFFTSTQANLRDEQSRTAQNGTHPKYKRLDGNDSVLYRTHLC